MTALCAGLDPEMWTPASDSARLALMICDLCTGCPDNDPAPHGVIRQGVAYSDAGNVLPECDDCGYPVPGYRGGHVVCPRCHPDIDIPDVAASRRRWVIGLSKRMTCAAAGLEAGLSERSVFRLRSRYGTQKVSA